MANAKACGVLARSHGRPVVAADTVVVVDGHILGKPADADDARRMLQLLSGRRHEVLTAVSVSLGEPDDSCPAASGLERTTVEFAPLSQAEISEVRGVRGAHGQGRRLRHSGPRLMLRHPDRWFLLQCGGAAGSSCL